MQVVAARSAAAGIRGVVIPRPLMALSTRELLVMQHMPGVVTALSNSTVSACENLGRKTLPLKLKERLQQSTTAKTAMLESYLDPFLWRVGLLRTFCYSDVPQL